MVQTAFPLTTRAVSGKRLVFLRENFIATPALPGSNPLTPLFWQMYVNGSLGNQPCRDVDLQDYSSRKKQFNYPTRAKPDEQVSLTRQIQIGHLKLFMFRGNPNVIERVLWDRIKGFSAGGGD